MNERYPILLKENIRIITVPTSRKEAIDRVGALLVTTGYVTDRYVQGMHDRDESLSVYLGNMLAIPHGEYEVKDEILRSGIAINIYPNGIDWGGEDVRVVLGLAGKGDEHMEILSNIAELFGDEDDVIKIVKETNIDVLFDIFTKGF